MDKTEGPEANNTSPERVPIPLFLHIPKCGGTTLTNCIYHCTHDRNYPHSDDRFLSDGVYYYPAGLHVENDGRVPPQARRALRNPGLRAVVGHFTFGIHRHLGKPGAYVTMLRHPVDRVASLYYHIRRYEDCELHKAINDRNISLQDFVRNLSCREADNDQTRRISGQNPGFGLCSPSILEQAKENLANSILVAGVTDLFDESLVMLRRAFDWEPLPFYLPGLVNPDRPAADSLSGDTIETILEFNALDLELYDFTRNMLLEKIARQGRAFQEDLRQFKSANTKHQLQNRTAAAGSQQLQETS